MDDLGWGMGYKDSKVPYGVVKAMYRMVYTSRQYGRGARLALLIYIDAHIPMHLHPSHQ